MELLELKVENLSKILGDKKLNLYDNSDNSEALLKILLKCIYCITSYEDSIDYKVEDGDIDILLSHEFIKAIFSGVFCSNENGPFYRMGIFISELFKRSERIIKKIKLDPQCVEFVYDYPDLEKIIIKSNDLKCVILKILEELKVKAEVFWC